MMTKARTTARWSAALFVLMGVVTGAVALNGSGQLSRLPGRNLAAEVGESGGSASPDASSSPPSGPVYGCLEWGSYCVECQTVEECRLLGAYPISSDFDICSNVACGVPKGQWAASSATAAGLPGTPSGCGDGTAVPGEQCGEPGLTCGAGQICNIASCTCSQLPPASTSSSSSSSSDSASSMSAQSDSSSSETQPPESSAPSGGTPEPSPPETPDFGPVVSCCSPDGTPIFGSLTKPECNPQTEDCFSEAYASCIADGGKTGDITLPLVDYIRKTGPGGAEVDAQQCEAVPPPAPEHFKCDSRIQAPGQIPNLCSPLGKKDKIKEVTVLSGKVFSPRADVCDPACRELQKYAECCLPGGGCVTALPQNCINIDSNGDGTGDGTAFPYDMQGTMTLCQSMQARGYCGL